MTKVTAYLDCDINLNDYDYLSEFSIPSVPELQGSNLTIFASKTIADKIIARNGKFTTSCGLVPKWEYEGTNLYFLTTPVSLVRKTIKDEYEYRLMVITDGKVSFTVMRSDSVTQEFLDQFNLVIPFNPDERRITC